MNTFTSRLLDAVICCLLVGFATVLFLHSLENQFLNTGYQDWIYHAYRIKEISLYGITSWTHVWSNGLNYWKMYQYVPHVLTYLLLLITHDTITHSMIVIIWLIFSFFIVFSYITLRTLKITRVAALLTILFVITGPALWAATSDFSIFFSVLFFPIYLAIFINDFKHYLTSYRLAAFAGVSWCVHPILGLICSILLGVFMFVKYISSKKWSVFFPLIIFFLTSSLFTSEYLTTGYKYSMASFNNFYFTRRTTSNDYYGLGVSAAIALGFSWLGMLLFAGKIPLWSKILTLFSSVMLIVVQLMLLGIAPGILYTFQLNRAMFLIVITIIFSSAPVINQLFLQKRRFFRIIAVAMIAILCIQIIEVTSKQFARPTSSLPEPVSQYFKTRPVPNGTVWTQDVSRASYFSNEKIRFATSYNGHLEPHPLSSRLNGLMQNDLAFTGITKKQVDLINAYSQVLGIEYIFLPKISSLVYSIAGTNTATTSSYIVAKDQDPSSEFVVLKNQAPISHAYIVPEKSELLLPSPPLPTISTQSWAPWDNAIVKLNTILKNTDNIPLTVTFPNPEKITITVSKPVAKNERILLMESFDTEWRTDVAGAKLEPTQTRFTLITLPENYSGNLTLTHSWPNWHWPVQIFSFCAAFLVIILETGFILGKVKKRHHE